MEAFGEVHLRITLLHVGGRNSIVLVTEQVIRDKTAKQGMYGERPSHWQASWVLSAGINDIGVFRLPGFDDKESECPGYQYFTKYLTVEGLCHSLQKTKEFHAVLVEKRFQGRVRQLDLTI